MTTTTIDNVSLPVLDVTEEQAELIALKILTDPLCLPADGPIVLVQACIQAPGGVGLYAVRLADAPTYPAVVKAAGLTKQWHAIVVLDGQVVAAYALDGHVVAAYALDGQVEVEV